MRSTSKHECIRKRSRVVESIVGVQLSLSLHLLLLTSRSRLPSPLSRLATIAAATHAFFRFEPSSHCTILGEWPIASRAHVRWMRWFCWSCMVAALREVILDMFFSSSPSTCSMAPAAATSRITRYDRGL